MPGAPLFSFAFDVFSAGLCRRVAVLHRVVERDDEQAPVVVPGDGVKRSKSRSHSSSRAVVIVATSCPSKSSAKRSDVGFSSLGDNERSHRLFSSRLLQLLNQFRCDAALFCRSDVRQQMFGRVFDRARVLGEPRIALLSHDAQPARKLCGFASFVLQLDSFSCA